ncbi:GNAT family N-acetyltransferase [Paenibacillus chitinolyticus]|uniref:GNAT family N-acetyltransferase n=1 Tax=Paenibacillus chitinolyticus TaxID=79263 RepID=UPI002DB9B5F9|nr:GNAT family N-acetyltransferase [Paenibacillus chitinolyticus]MEC0244942.1 GNAT family N-acetyltransferase [Paenibacillus chitinolyticus]
MNRYKNTKSLRSVEDMEDTDSSDQAVQLKEKPLGACDRIGERYSPTVELKPIDENNWYECAELEVSDEQKNVFPVPVVYWLAESAYCGFTPLAVYIDEQLIGFAVYAVDPDDGSYWIMAYMIDHKFQHKGLGRSGMEELVRYIHDKHGCDKIVLGHRAENERASRLYASLGFEEVDRDGIEIIRELTLSKP